MAPYLATVVGALVTHHWGLRYLECVAYGLVTILSQGVANIDDLERMLIL